MNAEYLTILRSSIKKQKSVKAQDQLKSKEWTKSCYELLAKLIHAKLMDTLTREQIIKIGSSISYKTLIKIFSKEYRISYPIDPRSLNTFNKLCIFCGYKGWNDFCNYAKETQAKKLAKKKPNKKLETVLSNALIESYKAIAELDLNGKTDIKQFYKTNSSAWKKLEEVVHHYKTKNCIIKNQFNPSTFELIDVKVESITDKKAFVNTKEFWLLCWYDDVEKKYIKRYKTISDHKYLLVQEKSGWKIKTNITTSDFIQN